MTLGVAVFALVPAAASALEAGATSASAGSGALTVVPIWWLSAFSAGSALLGTLAGALAPIIVGRMTLGAEGQRERLKLAVQLGLEDYQTRIDLLKSGMLPGQRALPLALYVDYHARLLAALNKGALTPEAFRRFHEEHTRVKEQFDNLPPYEIPRGPGKQA